MGKRLVLRASLLFALCVSALILVLNTRALAGGPLPPNDRARGLIYDGLSLVQADSTHGVFQLNLQGPARAHTLYTTGPEAAPAGTDLARTAAPVATSGVAAVCDGDGQSGPRVQLLYVRAADVPDRYAAYQASFQQWAADADSEYANSAAQTGGMRHIRFVQDAACVPTVTRVTLTATGDDSFGNTVTELLTQGYTRSDRKYVVFMDAHVYCGISNWENDDRAVATNNSNYGPSFARVDSGCWSGVIAAHELMHTLGGVQFSAPHADGTTHCTDGYDNMCDHSGTGKVTFTSCTNPAGDSLLDCNHDDYYNTNPPAGSYLATHWNAANSVFLIQTKYAPTAVTLSNFSARTDISRSVLILSLGAIGIVMLGILAFVFARSR